MPILLQAARPILADLAATFLFVALAAVTHDPLLATAVALVCAGAQLAWMLARRHPVGALQWLSLGLVAVLGTASLITHDLRFVMFKPSFVYLVIGAVMLQPGWMLRYIPERAKNRIPPEAATRWGYAWAGLMLLTAILNAGFAALSDFAAWSRFAAVFPLASKVVLFAAQYVRMRAAAMAARAPLIGAA